MFVGSGGRGGRGLVGGYSNFVRSFLGCIEANFTGEGFFCSMFEDPHSTKLTRFCVRALNSPGLDKDFDLGKLAQPFVEKLIESSRNNYDDDFAKSPSPFAKFTVNGSS